MVPDKLKFNPSYPKQVRDRDTAFPCPSAAILPKTDALLVAWLVVLQSQHTRDFWMSTSGAVLDSLIQIGFMHLWATGKLVSPRPPVTMMMTMPMRMAMTALAPVLLLILRPSRFPRFQRRTLDESLTVLTGNNTNTGGPLPQDYYEHFWAGPDWLQVHTIPCAANLLPLPSSSSSSSSSHLVGVGHDKTGESGQMLTGTTAAEAFVFVL